jgi:hypothetical protein
MPALFGRVRTPSKPTPFVRSFTRTARCKKVSRLLLTEPTRRPPQLPGKDVAAFLTSGPGSVHDRATGEVDLARGDGAGPVGRGEDGDVGDLVVAGQVAC